MTDATTANPGPLDDPYRNGYARGYAAGYIAAAKDGAPPPDGDAPWTITAIVPAGFPPAVADAITAALDGADDDPAFQAADGALRMLLSGTEWTPDARRALATQCAAPTPYTGGMHPVAYAAGLAVAAANRMLESDDDRAARLDGWAGRYDGNY